MNVREIKDAMLSWCDFYGQDLVETDRIKSAKSKKELFEVLNDHINFLQYQNIDAINHAEMFKKKLGLRLHD